MKCIFSLLLGLSLSIFVNAQDFKLIQPNTSLLWDIASNPKSLNDIVFIYFDIYYHNGQPMDSVKYYDVIEEYNQICSFQKGFSQEITYQYNTCAEHGILATVEIPLTPKSELTNWVEALFSENFVENVWNEAKTKYEPIDQGAGCYVDIMELEDRFKITYYCGC